MHTYPKYLKKKVLFWEKQNYRITSCCYSTAFASYKYMFKFHSYSKIQAQNMLIRMCTTKLPVVLQIPMSTGNTTKKFDKEKNPQTTIPYSVLADFEPNNCF